jgi:hypothetical protein
VGVHVRNVDEDEGLAIRPGIMVKLARLEPRISENLVAGGLKVPIGMSILPCSIWAKWNNRS